MSSDYYYFFPSLIFVTSSRSASYLLPSRSIIGMPGHHSRREKNAILNVGMRILVYLATELREFRVHYTQTTVIFHVMIMTDAGAHSKMPTSYVQ